MVTIRDIAIEANVSIATVSMALNGKDCISAKTTKKVLEAARKLNYIPSVSAQTLKTRRSRTLGLVVGNLSNTYFSDIVSAAEETARALSYQLFICDAGMRMENAMDCFRTLQAHNAVSYTHLSGYGCNSMGKDSVKNQELEAGKRRFKGAARLHDPATVAYIIAPEIFTEKKYYADVECRGELLTGYTFFDIEDYYGKSEEEKNVYLVESIDREAFVDLFIQAIRSYNRR